MQFTGLMPPVAYRSVVAAAKLAFAFLGFSALVTEVATLVARDRFAAGNFFSYFTVEANVLAVLSLVLSSYRTGSRMDAAGRRRLMWFRGAVTLYMTTTILVFIVLLSGYPSSELTAVPWDNTVLHYIMPIVVIADWLVDAPTRSLALRRACVWLVFPLAYLGYSVIRGAIVGWYPYPFMDPDQHGYAGVAITSIVIAIVLAAIVWAIASAPRLRGALMAATARDGRRSAP